MDVTSLLNTAGSAPVPTKSPRSSASPATTDSAHTVPSSALPTPSPERAFGPSECERSPRQSQPRWGPRGYSLPLGLESKPRQNSECSYQAADGRAETESEPCLYNSSRNNSVCSAEVTASGGHSPRIMISRILLSPRSSKTALSDSKVTKSFISPEQSDAEYGATEAKHSAPGNQPTCVSASRTHSRISSVTAIDTLQTGKEVALHHYRGTSLDHAENGQTNFHQTSTARSMPGVLAIEEHEFQSAPPFGSLGSKMLKRTMSAPDIAQCSVARMPRHTAPPVISEVSSSRPSIEQPIVEDSRLSPGATEVGASSSMKQDQEAYCMFVKDCDTGSQLRKAISHLFGRNKACTLRIPKHVWVYYCRKHYQRIRYRNAKTYPLNQMELVKLQILRLQAWSEENRRQRSGAYIRMWTLSLRKREQSRIENGGTSAVDEATAAMNDARSGASTAVPDWLVQRVASGYTTEEMLDVAERLHKEIQDGLLAQVPEIEFLPDIVNADSGAAAKPMRSSGRRQSRLSSSGGSVGGGMKTPKRKAPESLDFGRRDSVYSDGRGSDYYHHHHRGEETYDIVVSPSGKRARVIRPHYGVHHPDAAAQLPPLSSALSYGEMQPPPPPGMSSGPGAPPNPNRASNVVPRIQPLEYRRGSGHYGTPPGSYYSGQPPHQQQGGPHPHPPSRWEGGGHESPRSARSDGSYALSSSHTEYRHGSSEMRPLHHPQHPRHPHSHQPLPPITPQLEGGFPRGRPHHWRSASAYVPGDHHRPPIPGRPLSSGHDAPPSLPRPQSSGRPQGYAMDGRQEYEASAAQQYPPPPHQHAVPSPEVHEQGRYTYSWPRDSSHGSYPPPGPPVGHDQVSQGHVPRRAIPPSPAPPPHGYAGKSWSRDGRVVYGGRP